MSENTVEQPQDNSVFKQPPPQQPQLNKLSQEVGFDIPVESVPLPSKGAIYPVGHPLSNETNVDIKCMTAKEEDLLTSTGLIKNGTVISKLLQSCILNKTIDPDDLLVGDRNALLIAIRVTGYGPEYSAKVTCPECDAQFENDFSLAGLEVKPLGGKSLAPNTNLFEYTLPSGHRVEFRLLTGRDEADISALEKRNKKLGRTVESTVTSRLFHSIVSINGETDRNKLQRVVQNMPVRDSRALRNHIDSVEPSVQMKQWAKCTSCGEESEVRIPLGVSFFWPDLG